MGNVFVDAGHTLNYYADKWQERWAAPGLSMLIAFLFISYASRLCCKHHTQLASLRMLYDLQGAVAQQK
jgi:hypothetical protein